MSREAFFSEGRTLCVRMARPCARRDISFSPHALTMNRWPREDNTWVGVVPSLWACSARPSAGSAIRVRMALRGKPGDNARGDFLGGMRSARPHGKAELAPIHFISTTCVDDDPVGKGRER
jgi:hypothetical protein